MARNLKPIQPKSPAGKSRRAAPVDMSLVPQNSNGGILVTDEELAAAFEFFDVEGRGKITASNLRKRLGVFYKNMPAKEYKFLMDGKSQLTLGDLKELLSNNQVTNFDPVAEAFEVYDPNRTGFIDTDVLRTVFENLGFGTITDEDLEVLLQTGDIDKDGKISLNDFRGMLEVDFSESP
mmetsp:Transcript_20121/g.27345  ORF Transcript_20121/g.27345 Transcript_20121/m.27345 type:complete len:179 (-) Transcript_20121:279-815(-)